MRNPCSKRNETTVDCRLFDTVGENGGRFRGYKKLKKLKLNSYSNSNEKLLNESYGSNFVICCTINFTANSHKMDYFFYYR